MAICKYDEIAGIFRAEMLKALKPDCPIDRRIGFSNSYNGPLGSDMYVIQDHEEMASMIEVLEKRKPKVIVEVGTGHGGLALILAGLLQPGGILATVDLPNELGGGPSWRDEVIASIPSNGRVVPVRGNSHDTKTALQVEQEVGGPVVDFMFIDASHTYADVSHDFEVWNRLVKPGGIVAFHDICTMDVGYFWLRLTRMMAGNFTEIVSDWSRTGFGIGMWEKPCGN